MELVSPVIAAPPDYPGGNAVSEHEASKSIGQEAQLGVQWASSFGSSSS